MLQLSPGYFERSENELVVMARTSNNALNSAPDNRVPDVPVGLAG